MEEERMAVIPMLTPNNAVLTTASIEVAVLRLDKRQVTAAIFRQIHERSPIAANGGLIAGAVPWGLVNYFWSGAAEYEFQGDRNRVHLLWQLGNSLYRARFSDRRPAPPACIGRGFPIRRTSRAMGAPRSTALLTRRRPQPSRLTGPRPTPCSPASISSTSPPDASTACTPGLTAEYDHPACA
jgi:hypothetical protein